LLLKELEEEATYLYHPDHLGSVSVVSNHRGLPYERVEYLPFGEVWIEETDPATGYIPFRFTSKELDEETGLYYHGARYYEPTISRWMSADPAGFALISPMERDDEGGWKPKAGYSVIEAVNWYAYVSNNPVKYVDPTGMESADAAYSWYGGVDKQNQGWQESQAYGSAELASRGFYTSSDGYHPGGDYVKRNSEGSNITFGTPIYPDKAGTIVELRREDPGRGFGIYVGIEQKEGGMIEILAHLSEISPELEEGSSVDKTTAIGLAGNTGNSIGAHLHRQLHRDYTPSTLPESIKRGMNFQRGLYFDLSYSFVVQDFVGTKRVTAPVGKSWFMK